MKKKFLLLATALLFISGLSHVFSPTAYALEEEGGSGLRGLHNPLLPDKLAGNVIQAQRGETFAFLFIYFWNVLIIVGGLTVIIIFIMGAFDWITAGGDKGRLDGARQKIINAVVGMIILAGSYAVVSFIGDLFGFNLLRPNIGSVLPGNVPIEAPANIPNIPTN